VDAGVGAGVVGVVEVNVTVVEGTDCCCVFLGSERLFVAFCSFVAFGS
jgi:hypothetical protein